MYVVVCVMYPNGVCSCPRPAKDAFELAKLHDEVDAYATALEDDGTTDDYMAIARFYESKQRWGKAGEFFAICGQYHKALKLFLQCGESEMDKAIEVVGKARMDMLTHTLIDFLMGETDGVPKDPNYIFRLYMALGNYPQAAKTALIISRQEQELGNYKVAHNILYETIRDLEAQRIKTPQALRHAFMLLHSYILVKKLVKLGDHMNAAHMLIRVSKSISRFPSHTVPILTSTVIECQRAGLKQSAFEFASMLMRPEHRAEVNPKFKRKIEAIVRKRSSQVSVAQCRFADVFLCVCLVCLWGGSVCAVKHLVPTTWSRRRVTFCHVAESTNTTPNMTLLLTEPPSPTPKRNCPLRPYPVNRSLLPTSSAR